MILWRRNAYCSSCFASYTINLSLSSTFLPLVLLLSDAVFTNAGQYGGTRNYPCHERRNKSHWQNDAMKQTWFSLIWPPEMVSWRIKICYSMNRERLWMGPFSTNGSKLYNFWNRADELVLNSFIKKITSMNRLTKEVDTVIAHQNATAECQKEERDKKGLVQTHIIQYNLNTDNKQIMQRLTQTWMAKTNVFVMKLITST